MRVLFLGTPAFAAASLEALLEAGHEVAGVVTRPDAPSGRGLRPRPSPVGQLASRRGIAVLQPASVNAPEVAAQVADLTPEILVVVAFGAILPPVLLEAAPRGAVNVHASLLPRYRGAAPVAWAIVRGERETGITTMRMVQRLDAGDILLQRAIAIAPDETAGELEERLSALGAAVLIETLQGIAAGAITPRPQDESRATYAPALRKEEALIDWAMPPEEIARRVRGFNPRPVAHTPIPGPSLRRLRIWRAAPLDTPAGGAAPGTVVARIAASGSTGGGAAVACGCGGCLLLLEVQPEGGRRMPALEALSGRHLREGDRLGAG